MDLYAPEVYEHSLKVAKSIFDSRAANNPWISNEHTVLYIMQRGCDLGVPPLVALEEIKKVKGSWFVSINLAKALAIRAGGSLHVEDESNERMVIRAERNGWKPHIETTTIAELLAAGIDKQFDREKRKYVDNPVWKKFPRQMWRAVCIRRIFQFMFADVLLGMVPVDFSVEEIPDFEDEAAGLDPAEVTESDHKPKKTKKKAGKNGTKAKKPGQESEDGSGSSCGGNGEHGKNDDGNENPVKVDAGCNGVAGGEVDKSGDHPLAPPADRKELELVRATGQAEPLEKPTVEEIGKKVEERKKQVDFDLETRQTDEPFNIKKAEHKRLMVPALQGSGLEPEQRVYVQANFAQYINDHADEMTANVANLTEHIKQCASQMHS